MDFAEILGRIAGSMQKGGTEILGQLRPWVMRLVAEAAPKWLPMHAMGIRCSMQNPDQQQCRDTALVTCLLCRHPICLAHAFVDSEGDAVCFGCVGQAVHRLQEQIASNAWAQKNESHQAYQQQREASRQQRQQPDPQEQARRQAEQQAQQDVFWACGVLGVTPDTPFDVIKSQHKKLSAQSHPDRKGGNEKNFKDVQRAFEIMKKLKGET